MLVPNVVKKSFIYKSRENCFQRELCYHALQDSWRHVWSLVVQMVKNIPAMQETKLWPLGREDPLEKGMATHSGILAWRIPWTEEPGGLWFMGSQRVRHNWVTKIFILICSWDFNMEWVLVLTECYSMSTTKKKKSWFIWAGHSRSWLCPDSVSGSQWSICWKNRIFQEVDTYDSLSITQLHKSEIGKITSKAMPISPWNL